MRTLIDMTREELDGRKARFTHEMDYEVVDGVSYSDGLDKKLCESEYIYIRQDADCRMFVVKNGTEFTFTFKPSYNRNTKSSGYQCYIVLPDGLELDVMREYMEAELL